ncbi:MAG: HAD-IA family hydrolase [Myxococcota bacterium]
MRASGMHSEIKAVIFDLDGTLIDSIGDIARSMNAALAEDGHPVWSVDEYRSWVGAGSRHMVSQAVPAGADLARMYDRYMAAYRERPVVHTRPYPGIPAALAGLRERGLPLAVLTNKVHDVARVVVGEVFAGIRFERVEGVQDPALAKPDPTTLLAIVAHMGVPAQQCLMVGDTLIDVEAGKRAGARTMGVTWGYRSAEVIRGGEPDYVVDEPGALYERIAALC